MLSSEVMIEREFPFRICRIDFSLGDPKEVAKSSRFMAVKRMLISILQRLGITNLMPLSREVRSIQFVGFENLSKADINLIALRVREALIDAMGWVPYTPNGKEHCSMLVQLCYQHRDSYLVDKKTIAHVFFNSEEPWDDAQAQLYYLTNNPVLDIRLYPTLQVKAKRYLPN